MSMHESLIAYIKRYSATPLTEAEIEVIKESFVPKKFRKRQYLLQEGQVCKHGAFIVKGAMRKYSVDDKGVEHIISLYIENWWPFDRESYVMLTPSAVNIDAWEDTEVLLVTQADFVSRLSSIPAVNEMTRKMDDNYSIAAQKRVASSISLSAEERYSTLIKPTRNFCSAFPNTS
jgi:CRP-like cAMP-binding protein